MKSRNLDAAIAALVREANTNGASLADISQLINCSSSKRQMKRCATRAKASMYRLTRQRRHNGEAPDCRSHRHDRSIKPLTK
jgi:hypothetical protein